MRQVDTQKKLKKGNIIRASVVFGQPSIACHGNGLCRVDLDTAMKHDSSVFPNAFGESCERVPALFTYSEGEGLKIVISTQEISAQTYYRQFSEPFFQLVEPFQFSDEISEALELKSTLLPQGCYRISKTKECIVVYLSGRIALKGN